MATASVYRPQRRLSRRRRKRLARLAVLGMGMLLLLTLGMVKIYGLLRGGHSARPLAGLNNSLHGVNKGSAKNSVFVASGQIVKQLKTVGANESGSFPILEYHDILNGSNRMRRSPERFRGDLERLYKENYRPITLRDYIDNKIDLPAGMTPVVLTFDDARLSQFVYLPDGRIDPDCAVGILQAFAKSHPDFPLKATFFVLSDSGFGQPKLIQKKFAALLQMGCDLQNHTKNHSYFGRISDDAIIKDIARGKDETEKITPGAHVDILALPGGEFPHSKNNAILVSGTYNNIHYKNAAVIMAWGGPAPSPVSAKYNPYRIPRIEPVSGDDGLTHWLDYLKKHANERYISDGDPKTVSVPKASQKQVKLARLQGNILRVY